MEIKKEWKEIQVHPNFAIAFTFFALFILPLIATGLMRIAIKFCEIFKI